MRELSDRLIELHGQHEHQVLGDPESHLTLLDAYAGLSSARAEVGEAFANVQRLRTELQASQLNEREKAARIDLLTFQRDEIARAHLRAGEDDECAATRQVLANAEKLQRLSGEAYAALYESDGAVLGALTAVWRKVGELATLDPRVSPYLEARDTIKSQLEDLAFFLRGYAAGIDASPARLQEVEDRLVLLDRLKRKYGPSLADVHSPLRGLRRSELDKSRGSGRTRQSAFATELGSRERGVPGRGGSALGSAPSGRGSVRIGARTEPRRARHGADAVRGAVRRHHCQ